MAWDVKVLRAPSPALTRVPTFTPAWPQTLRALVTSCRFFSWRGLRNLHPLQRHAMPCKAVSYCMNP